MSYGQISCKKCKVKNLCIAGKLDEKKLEVIDDITQRDQSLKKGEHLFYEGESFRSIFVIREGSVKSYLATHEGEEQIIRFFLPGELVGICSIGSRHYPFSACAIENTRVCEIPYHVIESLCDEVSEFRDDVMRRLGQYFMEDQQLKILLMKKTSEERVASFLVSFALRIYDRRNSVYSISLPFSRHDMGNYLGMKLETVSRSFSRLQASGVIKVSGKNILITDMQKLCSISGSKDACTLMTLLKKNIPEKRHFHHDTV